MFEKESEIGAILLPWLESEGWEVFPEVEIYKTSPIADLVCRRGKIIWVIELKKSLTLDLLAQASYWERHANYVSVAVPALKRKKERTTQFAERVLRDYGIGLIKIQQQGRDFSIYEHIRPKFVRKVFPGCFKILNEGHQKMGVAGTSSSERWTPFKETVQNVKAFLKKNPGATYKEVMSGIKHHWHTSTTGRQCLVKYLRTGVIKGIRVDDSTHKHRLYLE